MKSLEQVLAEHPSAFNPALERPWVCIGCFENGVTSTFSTHEDWAAHVAAVWREERTVRTLAEVDALPPGTVIRTALNIALTLRGNGSIEAPIGGSGGVARIGGKSLPALVLWLSGEEVS